jgi:hypothetical protein
MYGCDSKQELHGRITEIYQELKPHELLPLVRLILRLILMKAEVHAREIRLALYSEALSTMAEGPVPAISSSKRSRSPGRLPDEDSNLEPSG